MGREVKVRDSARWGGGKLDESEKGERGKGKDLRLIPHIKDLGKKKARCPLIKKITHWIKIEPE